MCASDYALIDKMVEAASSSTILLYEEAFVNALTLDLSEWKIGSEDNLATSFFDVYGFESYQEKENIEGEEKSRTTNNPMYHNRITA